MLEDPVLHTIYGDAETDGPIRVSEPELDVVAVHGLNFKGSPRHARATWHSRGAVWIKDFLPQRLGRPCRVMLFEYNSSPAKAAAARMLDDHAKSLLGRLMDKRKDAPQRPIIFLCHSLGGIVVKSALVEGTLDPAYRSIVKSTRLLVFFATPHLGGNWSRAGDIAAKVVRTSRGIPSNDLLDGLKTGSRDVIRRFEQGRHLPDSCLVISFYETESYGRLGLIVEKESAVMNLPPDKEKQVARKANHSSICKFPTAESCEPVMGLIAEQYDRAEAIHEAAEPSSVNVHYLVPRDPSRWFTGRDEIVHRMVESITSDEALKSKMQRRFVLTGLGGQGKSEVCLKVVDQVRSLFWGIFWVDVSSRATAAAGFTKIAKLILDKEKEEKEKKDKDKDKEKEKEIEKVRYVGGVADLDDVKLLLANSTVDKKWLLILDNADDRNIDYHEFLPSGNRGMVLMTSRLPECSIYGSAGHEEIDSLGKEDGLSLLFKAAEIPEEKYAENLRAAEEVANEVGFHTLALVQAGAYIAWGRSSMADYPSILRQQKDRLLKSGFRQSRSRYHNVYATFEASVQALTASGAKDKQDALELLHFLSTVHYDNIPLDLFIDSRDGIKLARRNQPGDDAIDRLCDWHVSQLPDFLGPDDASWKWTQLLHTLSELTVLSLVKSSRVGGVYTISLHPLVHEWIAERQEAAERHARLRSTSCIFALWAYASPGWRAYKGHLGPHLSVLVSSTMRLKDALTSVHSVQCFFQIGHLLQSLRHDEELANLLARVFTRLNVVDCSSPVDDLLPLFYLKSLNERDLGNVKLSISILTKTLEIQRADQATNSLEKLRYEKELGSAYLENGQIKRSIAMFEEMERIQSLNADMSETSAAALKYELGTAYRADGQTKKAIDAMEQVIQIYSKHLGEGDVARIPPAYELARNYLGDSRIKEAIELFNQTIQIAQRQLRSQHPTLLALRDGLGRALLSNGQTKEAIDIFEQISNVDRASLAPHHPVKLASLHILATAYNNNGQTQDAITTFEEILRLSRADEDHPNRLETQLALGISYIADGKMDKAIRLLEKTCSVQEHVFDEDHPARVSAQMELADAYGRVGRFSEAVDVLEKAVALQELNLDEGHGNRLAAQYSLALACLNAGQISRSISVLEDVVRLEEIATDDNEQQRAVSKQALGRAYLADGQVGPAIALFTEVIGVLSAAMPESHPSLLATKHELGRAYVMDGKTAKAIGVFEDVVRIQSDSLDASHPDQMATKRMLGLAYLESHRTTEATNTLAEVVEIEKASVDEANPGLLASRHGLARCYLANNRAEEAIALLEDVDRIKSSVLPADHPDVLRTKQQLGVAYVAQNKTKEAISILADVVAVYSERNQNNHPSSLIARYELGLAYVKDGQVEEGMKVLEDVVQSQAHLDEGHPNRLASQYELGCCYLTLQRLDDAISILNEVVRVETATQGRDSLSLSMSLAKLGSAHLKKGNTKEAVQVLTSASVIRRTHLEPDNLARLRSEHDLALAYLESGSRKKGVALLEEILAVERQSLEQHHPLRLKTQYELACAYLDARKAEQAILLLENMIRIKEGHPGGGYPTLTEVQNELARAHRERKLSFRVLRTCGIKK